MTEHVFDTDTAVTPSGKGSFSGHLHERWTIGEVPNGGYAMALMLRANQAVSDHPHPLTTTAHFLSPTSAGPVEVTTRVEKPGRSTTTVSSSLIQEGRQRITMLTTLGRLDTRSGPTTRYLEPPSLEGPFEQRRSLLMQRFPENFDFRIPEAVAGGIVGEPTGSPEIGGTIAFSDGREPDLLALAVMADGFPPVAFNLGHAAWTPTLELTIHFWNHPAPGPITAWFRAETMEGGYHDESATLWDSTGAVVARSRQLAVIL